MSDYILDSSAWIDYFLANEAGETVRKIIESSGNAIFTSSLSVAEVTIKLKKLDLDYKHAFETVKRLSFILPIDDALGFEAGCAYVEKRKKLSDIGIADVVIMAHAEKDNLTIVTKDRDHFKHEKNVVFI